jgi:hypothetical protein
MKQHLDNDSGTHKATEAFPTTTMGWEHLQLQNGKRMAMLHQTKQKEQ